MKKLFWLAACVALVTSCKEAETPGEEKPKEETAKAMPALPKDVAYKGEASIGSSENMITVMNWNRFLESNQLDSAAMLLADSLQVDLEDGTRLKGSRDTVMAAARQMISSFDSVKVDIVAVLPVNVKTENGTDEWVFSWTDEKYTGKKGGNSMHMNIHEDYQLKNGKIIRVIQYRQVPPKQ